MTCTAVKYSWRKYAFSLTELFRRRTSGVLCTILPGRPKVNKELKTVQKAEFVDFKWSVRQCCRRVKLALNLYATSAAAADHDTLLKNQWTV